jgi:hypothetical protein
VERNPKLREREEAEMELQARTASATAELLPYEGTRNSKISGLWWRFLPAKFGHIFGLFPPNVNYSTN